jgi:hypothetical protein
VLARLKAPAQTSRIRATAHVYLLRFMMLGFQECVLVVVVGWSGGKRHDRYRGAKATTAVVDAATSCHLALLVIYVLSFLCRQGSRARLYFS